MATVDVLGPFEVLKRPLTLKPAEARPPPARGLVGWWKFDEREGATAADASGNRSEGRIRGQPRWMPDAGRVGGALEFDGNNTFVDCGDAELLEFREAMTFAAWMKVRQFEKQAPVLACKGGTWQLQFTGDQRHVNFALTGPQTTSKTGSSAAKSKRTVHDGQWHHVAAVYDGKRIALYLDGALEDAVAATGPIAASTEPVTVGQHSTRRSPAFNGWVDDLRLYDRGLSEDEVRALFRGAAK